MMSRCGQPARRIIPKENKLPSVINGLVNGVDTVNRVVGRSVMYLVYVMIAVLLYSAIMRSVFKVNLVWVMEMSQFMMSAYYLLGGAYSMQLGAHVRMDLFYSRWTPRTRNRVDAFTMVFLITYLVFLLLGGISSTQYALEYNQKNYTAWGPPLAPIKIIMTIGIGLMLLQAISIFIRNVSAAFAEIRS